MEGPLRKYKNFMSGYKEVNCKIFTSSANTMTSPRTGGRYLAIQSKSKASAGVHEKIPLRNAVIKKKDTSDDPSQTDFILISMGAGSKKQFHEFRASDQKVRDQWIAALNSASLTPKSSFAESPTMQ